jgi:hypothetical protein
MWVASLFKVQNSPDLPGITADMRHQVRCLQLSYCMIIAPGAFELIPDVIISKDTTCCTRVAYGRDRQSSYSADEKSWGTNFFWPSYHKYPTVCCLRLWPSPLGGWTVGQCSTPNLGSAQLLETTRAWSWGILKTS